MNTRARLEQSSRFFRRHHLVLGWGLATALAIFLPILYTPYWHTSDDPWIAMLIFGYGLAEVPTLNIPFSNFAWAWLLQQFPAFLDISVYTLALYFFTWLALLVIWYILASEKKFLFIKLLFLGCMAFYAFLNPQYTVTAFYSAAAALLALCFPRGRYTPQRLIVIAFMFLLSFIIRMESLIGIVLVGAIYIPWQQIRRDKRALAGALLTLALAGSLYFADHSMKSGPEWQEVTGWHEMRAKLSDGRVGDMLKNQPAILEKYGLSRNDMQMVGNQFGGDAGLRELGRLQKMCAEIPALFYFLQKFEEIKKTFLHFMDPPLLFLMVLALMMLANRLDWKRGIAALMFLLGFLLIGYFNRGGEPINRIYYPLTFFLLALLLLTVRSRSRKEIRILFDIQFKMGIRNYGIMSNRKIFPLVASFLLIITAISFSRANLIQQWRLSQYDLPASRAAFDNSFWFGFHYPLEWLYPPFAPLSVIRGPRFQSGGWPILEPGSRKYFDQDAPEAFLEFLSTGFRFSMGEEDIKTMRIYCREHLNGELEYTLVSNEKSLPIYFARCVAGRH